MLTTLKGILRKFQKNFEEISEKLWKNFEEIIFHAIFLKISVQISGKSKGCCISWLMVCQRLRGYLRVVALSDPIIHNFRLILIHHLKKSDQKIDWWIKRSEKINQLKARPHLYTNANEARGIETITNECQKVACSAFTAQANEEAWLPEWV